MAASHNCACAALFPLLRRPNEKVKNKGNKEEAPPDRRSLLGRKCSLCYLLRRSREETVGCAVIRDMKLFSFTKRQIRMDASSRLTSRIMAILVVAGQAKAAQSDCAAAGIQTLAKLIAAIITFSFPEDGRSVAHIFIQRKRVFIGLPQDRLKRQNFALLCFPYWINR